MPTPYERPAAARDADPARVGAPTRPPLLRPVEGRVVGGVCAGVAHHLGQPTNVVRWLMVVLGIFGPGLIVYFFLWALVPEGEQAQAAAVSPPAVRAFDGLATSMWGPVVAVGTLVVVGGLAAAAQVAGWNVRASVLLPLLVVAAGAIIAWSHLDTTRRNHWLDAGSGARGYVWARVALGLALAVVGGLVLAFAVTSVSDLGGALLATVAVLAGVAIIGAPWALRLWGDLRAEQTAAARANERADIAAHLHDSVLQTLALIQRRAHDPATVAQLARAQERELRSWLYAGPTGSDDTLASAMTAAAHEVEDGTGVPVELVVTGERGLDADGLALVRAFREALLNATRHGRPPVTAYVEIGTGAQGVEAFVRDRGAGFEVEDIPPDRLGVRQSILGRMERHGGSARVRRLSDGTEVELRLPPRQEASVS